ncbi:hypothetical protein F5Y01DRAFT_328896 [Xylaria sp. FL0043]|nr:hypothetical protein F5Y01DRAFT_328896 [Xylaria sp. FL0043]
MQLRLNEFDQLRRREKLLESLWFPEIDQRRDEIKEPAPSTLGWIFRSGFELDSKSEQDSEPERDSENSESGQDLEDSEPGQNLELELDSGLTRDSESELDPGCELDPELGQDSESGLDSESEQDVYISQHFPNFRKWLREDASMYWISGKAGSGKSTLMAHIIDDERTHEDLEIWSSGKRLRLLSFFFWRAGSQLQKSVLGLLRSLLYQLCHLEPAIADAVLSRLSSPGATMPTWTERSLLSYTTEALQSSRDVRFCIFIDGLDEYTGPYDDLVDHIDKLRAFGNVKMCISSRPELELVNSFRDFKQLRLQDLNYHDIWTFVEESLAKVQLTKYLRASLVRDIVWRAEGVFLWASLVTQSLMKGSKLGDSEEVMQERLDSLPKDMNHLFERILSDVDLVHRKSLAFYVQIRNLETKYMDYYGISIPIILTAQLDKRIDSYVDFAIECERTEIQITTRSAGLLEIGDSDPHPPYRRLGWAEATFKYVGNQPDAMLNSRVLDRRVCPDNEPYPVLLDYEDRYMKWIHRSAFEFLSDPNRNPIFKSSWSDEQLLQHIGNSWINYIIYAPTYAGAKLVPLMRLRLETLFTFIRDWYNDYPTMASTLLDRLCSLYAQVCVDELWGVTEFEWSTTVPVGKFIFWKAIALLPKLYPYILSRMECISKEPDCDWLFADIFASFASLTSNFLPTRLSASISNGFFAKFENTLADTLLQCTFHRFEGQRSFRASEYQCILWDGHRMNCATWRKPTAGDYIIVMMRLVYILQCYTDGGIDHDSFLPTSLCTLMGMADLYISPALGLDRVHLQLSAKLWSDIMYSFREATARKRRDGNMRATTATEIDGAVRVLCVPSLKRGKAVSAARCQSAHGGDITLTCWSRPTELRFSEFIVLRPSTATSYQLLSLIRHQIFQRKVRLCIIPDRQKLCKVSEMLLKDIKSAEQGLDGGQRLIAAACVRAGFLNLNLESILEDLTDSGDDI